MAAYGFIPARLNSTRLPQKMLLSETGKPLIQHTWESACRADRIDQIVIATDSAEIRDAVQNFGGEVVMTGRHPSGSDRIAEAVESSFPDADLIVNIQGDEPDVSPAHLNQLVEEMQSGCEMATLATRAQSLEELSDSARVKVVTDRNGRALYFSRSTIPWPGTVPPHKNALSNWLIHRGLYGYRCDFLLEYAGLSGGTLEEVESLEQLRALEHGATIQVAVVEGEFFTIDTPEDYRQFVLHATSCGRSEEFPQ